MLASFPGFLFSFFSCLYIQKFVQYNTSNADSLFALERKEKAWSLNLTAFMTSHARGRKAVVVSANDV